MKQLTKKDKDFLKDFIKKAIKDYEEHWEFGNQILYNMCEEYPEHDKEYLKICKVWLIGRSYAAALERRKNKGKKDIYIELAEKKKDFEKIDKQIKRLKNCITIDNCNIEYILNLHNKLVKIYKKVTDLDKISLASKYLHFHLPNLFYLYDSRAKKAIDGIIKIKDIKNFLQYDDKYADFFKKVDTFRKKLKSIKKKDVENSSKNDNKYADFFKKVYAFHKKLEIFTQKEYTPRNIDCILLHYHKTYLVNKKSKKNNKLEEIIKKI